MTGCRGLYLKLGRDLHRLEGDVLLPKRVLVAFCQSCPLDLTLALEDAVHIPPGAPFAELLQGLCCPRATGLSFQLLPP